MIHKLGLSRRALIKSAAGTALVAGIGMPAISRAQSDVIRIGHLTPRTGFLGPLGEYAVQAMDMAVCAVHAARGVPGRERGLLKGTPGDPPTASVNAERAEERGKAPRPTRLFPPPPP